MKRLLAGFLGAVIGGGLAVVLGTAAAIREANDRALQAREVANDAMAAGEVARETISRQRAELDRLKKGPKSA